MSDQQPPQFPAGQYPPYQGPPQGQYPPYQGQGAPLGQYPPYQEPPREQFPPGQYPPYQGPPQGQPVQQRRGCRGCIIGCLVAALILALLISGVIAAGAYMVRQMFPTTDSVQQAAGCAVMRLFANNLESAVADSDASEDEKAGMRRELEQLRREFEEQCGSLR